MRILSISHLYPRDRRPANGIFIHRQMAAIQAAGGTVMSVVLLPSVPQPFKKIARWSHYDQKRVHMTIDGVDVVYSKVWKTPSAMLHGVGVSVVSLQAVRNVGRLIRRFSPNVIHGHGATPGGYVAVRLGQAFGVPAICSLMGRDIHVYPFTSKWAMRLTQKTLSMAEAVVSNNHALAGDASRLLATNTPIEVVYRGCDTSLFSKSLLLRNQFRSVLGIKNDRQVISWVATVCKDKNFGLLVDAVAMLRDRGLDLSVIVVGRVADTDLPSVVRAHNLDDSFHFVGQRSADEVAGFMNAGDVFVLPSTREGMPNALLEAMSCGLPPIVTPVGGMPEVVISGYNGRVMDSVSAEALSGELAYMLSDTSRLAVMGERARATILRGFSWEKSANKYLKIYGRYC